MKLKSRCGLGAIFSSCSPPTFLTTWSLPAPNQQWRIFFTSNSSHASNLWLPLSLTSRPRFRKLIRLGQAHLDDVLLDKLTVNWLVSLIAPVKFFWHHDTDIPSYSQVPPSFKRRKLYKEHTKRGGNLSSHVKILPTTDRVTISDFPRELSGVKKRQAKTTTDHSARVRMREPEYI